MTTVCLKLLGQKFLAVCCCHVCIHRAGSAFRTEDACGRTRSKREPGASRTRCLGLSAQETKLSAIRTTSTPTCQVSAPVAKAETAAPLMLKKIPAYAHSLSRGNRGYNNAIAAISFQNPMIETK